MAIGVHKRDSIIGIMEESAEKTYTVPSGVTKYMQVENDFNVKITRDLKEREFITGSIGLPKPLVGMKSAEASLTFEARGGADGGTKPDYAPILKSFFGSEVVRASDYLTDASSTTTSLIMAAGAGANFAVGDMVLIKKGTGNSAVRFVTAKATDTLTIAPALAAGEVPGTGVTVSGAVTYKPANSAHVSLSLSCYWGNQIREAIIGAKVKSFSLAAWEVGEIPKFTCNLQALSYTRIDGAAPHTPTYVSQLPCVVLNAVLMKDGVATQVKGISLAGDQEIIKAYDVADADGATAQYVTKRTITGSINPYLDDTSVANFTSYNASTSFSLLLTIGNVDSSGDFVEGSIIGVYLPQCVFTENSIGDDGGLLMENLNFRAHRGDTGTTDEIYLGIG